MHYHELSAPFQKKGDERLSLTAEFIAGIRMLKLNALEFVYKEKIQKIRKAELKLLMKDSVFWAFNSTCCNPTPCYFVYMLRGGSPLRLVPGVFKCSAESDDEVAIVWRSPDWLAFDN